MELCVNRPHLKVCGFSSDDVDPKGRWYGKWMHMKWPETDFRTFGLVILYVFFVFFHLDGGKQNIYIYQFQACQRHTSLQYHINHINYARMVIDWCVQYNLLHEVTKLNKIAFSRRIRHVFEIGRSHELVELLLIELTLFCDPFDLCDLPGSLSWNYFVRPYDRCPWFTHIGIKQCKCDVTSQWFRTSICALCGFVI